MSHYCCKRCGQRYEHCVCPDVQPTSPIAMDEENTLDEHAPFWDDDLACHHTLGEPAGLLKQVTAELDRLLPTNPDQVPYSCVTDLGKQIMEAAKCTCLTNQLGPHYCEKCSP